MNSVVIASLQCPSCGAKLADNGGKVSCPECRICVTCE